MNTPDTPTETLSESKARHELAGAELLELKIERRLAELVNKAGANEAERLWRRLLEKALLQDFPRHIATEAVAHSDPWEFELFLKDKMRETLAALASLTPEEIESQGA